MKLKSVVAASFAVLVLAGCGSQAAAPAPVVTVTKSVEAPAAPAYGSDIANQVRSQDPWFENVPDHQIEETAQLICDSLYAGNSLVDIIDIAGATIGYDHAPAIIAGALVYYCPDMKYLVDQY
jgi:ABC-type glycerol-3-phosphate transport system substrate-binding protein